MQWLDITLQGGFVPNFRNFAAIYTYASGEHRYRFSVIGR
jgi:hypothetical protein